jgi:hypothetical protein
LVQLGTWCGGGPPFLDSISTTVEDEDEDEDEDEE